MSKRQKIRLASLALAGLSAVASGCVLAGMAVDSKGGINKVFGLFLTDEGRLIRQAERLETELRKLNERDA